MIYFDNNATTKVLPEVREAMLPYLGSEYGNPSSAYQLGNHNRVVVERARAAIAGCIGAVPSELVFTGSGTEANNHAIMGTLLHQKKQGKKNMVISAVEHPAVTKAAQWVAELLDMEVRTAPITYKDGNIDTAPFLDLMDDETAMVSVMLVNNETGVVLPVAELFKEASKRGIVTHCDAIQALGKVRICVKDLSCDLLSLSAHKFHGPKGIGCLFVRRGTKLEAIIHGGSQENARRAGTENVPAIAGMAKAAELAMDNPIDDIQTLRDTFEKSLEDRLGERIRINFKDLNRTPNTSSIVFKDQDANLLLIKLDRKGVCASTGSACSSGTLSASPILLAMGLDKKQAEATLRFSFSKLNHLSEVERAVETLKKIIRN